METKKIIDKTIVYELLANKFLSVKHALEFANLLMVDPVKLNYHINKPLYYSFQVPKKSGGIRKIQSPNEDLKRIQKSLNYFLQLVYLSVKPNSVHGFVRKPGTKDVVFNIISNAAVHVNSKYVLNMDLQDFFPSISAKQVRDVLLAEPFNFCPEIATLVALLGSYEKRLPTGSPCSPVLANMVCYEMDKELELYCLVNSINYTRYADDLSFSGNNYFEQNTIDQIKTIINKNQFTVNTKKTRVHSSCSQQTVTGLVVNQKVNVDRKYIRNLRAILHHWKLNGVEKATLKHFNGLYDSLKFINKIKGKIEFVGQVRGKEDGIYIKLKEKFISNSV
jgi:RNA-directed DNA polymerase